MEAHTTCLCTRSRQDGASQSLVPTLGRFNIQDDLNDSLLTPPIAPSLYVGSLHQPSGLGCLGSHRCGIEPLGCWGGSRRTLIHRVGGWVGGGRICIHQKEAICPSFDAMCLYFILVSLSLPTAIVILFPLFQLIHQCLIVLIYHSFVLSKI